MVAKKQLRRIPEHDRLRLQRKEVPADLSIADKGVAAIGAGLTFARENLMATSRVPHLAARRHREMGRLRGLSEGNHATLLFLQSVFGHASAWAILESGHAPLAAQRRARRIHVISFQKLVASLLALSATSRDRLWEHAHRLSPMTTDDRWQWEVFFSGAIAVARTAYALLRLDLAVYLPTAFEKLGLDLDLLCAVPDSKEGLGLRIRSSGAESFSTYAALTHDPSHNGFAHRSDLRHLWNAMQEFNGHYGVKWTGVDLVVGLRGEMASEVERALSPHTLIWNDLVPTLLETIPIESEATLFHMP